MLSLIRRRLRIGIGGMMVLILGLGLWMGYEVNRAKIQRRAVDAVKADGGHVLYADEFTMGRVNVLASNRMMMPGWGTLIPKKGPAKPGLIERWLGDEFVREVVHVSVFVDIEGGRMTAPNELPHPLDDVLVDLRSQSSIKTLQLGAETITDKGLASVAELTNLEELVIWWATKITDDGMARLSQMPRLRMVDISLSKLTDEGVRHLAQLPSLEDLSLQGKSFSDQSLLYLSKVKTLKTLTLQMKESKITDEGIKHLESLPNLRILQLENTKISEAARNRLLKANPKLEIIP